MFDSIVTTRLELRRPAMSDLAALVERRNDPSVAKYQDWQLPFELDSARQLLAGTAKMQGPTRGQWWMVTVVDRTRPSQAPLGDLAVHLNEDGREAEIGYTFAVVGQGRGYATEAVGALVDYLFDDVGVSRVSASLHPDNVASAMVLERTGFDYEGRTRRSHWRGEGSDAVYSDALFYGLTEPDHRTWQAMSTRPPSHVELIQISADNHHKVSKLVSHKSQDRRLRKASAMPYSRNSLTTCRSFRGYAR